MARYDRTSFPPGFQWDPRKYDFNLKKWRVPFEVAAQVFADPLMEEELDLRFDYGEPRFIAIGEAQDLLLYVAFTLRGDDDDVIHIISARRLIQRKGELMRRGGLNLSDEERAAIQAMTEEEMEEAAKDDPDAREMTAEMLAHHAPNARLERSRAKRQAAARAIVEQARAEAEAAREREDVGK